MLQQTPPGVRQRGKGSYAITPEGERTSTTLQHHEVELEM